MRLRVYFYCLEYAEAYQDDVVIIAAGLKELGAEVYGNCNYWRNSPDADDWLVKHDPRITPAECDIVVVSSAWSRWLNANFVTTSRPLPAGLFATGRRYRTAYFDIDDGYVTSSWRPEYQSFDCVFRAQYNRRCYQPSGYRPWVLVLTPRVLRMTEGGPPWAERLPELLVNFGASHPYVHSARAEAGPPFLEAARHHFRINDRRDDLTVAPGDPYDRLMWEQTQHRHCRAYYERLKSAQAVVAFCGELIPPAPYRPTYLVGGGRANLKLRAYKLLATLDSRPRRLIQWDSWRFWEALSAGCLVFNLDLPFHGIELPVMPRDLEHYVAIRPGNAAAVLDRLMREPGLAGRIAAQGRAWALDNYSPKALARRFLDTILG